MGKIKIGIGILLVFIIGGLSGVLGTQLYLKNQFEQFDKAGPPHLERFFMKKLSQELNLTEAQKQDIKRIVNQSMVKLHEVKQRFAPEIEKIMDQSFALIKEKLTDDQKKEFETLQEKMKKFREHKGPHDVFHPGPMNRNPEQILTDMKERLNLSPEMETQFRPIIDGEIKKREEILEKYREQKRQSFDAQRTELKQLNKETEEKLSALLNPEQMNEFRKIQGEQGQMLRGPGCRRPHELNFREPAHSFQSKLVP
jgi:Spy/CpxP family protein refolding chaperone